MERFKGQKCCTLRQVNEWPGQAHHMGHLSTLAAAINFGNTKLIPINHFTLLATWYVKI